MDPLLSSLCTICRIDPPKYTCPRCSAQTCSLRCSKRHKLWSSCDGIRDPTVFMPMSQLATPAGIDHDYNFLHSIETRVQRSEKVLIEDLGIVTRAELKRARGGEDEEKWKSAHNHVAPGVVQIERMLIANRIRVVKAPKGMRRNKENTTSWIKRSAAIHWQVEWIRPEPLGRTLYKAMGHMPIGHSYDLMCEEERKLNMTEQERRLEKKRKTAARMEETKRLKLDSEIVGFTTVPLLQNPQTSTWEIQEPDMPDEEMEGSTPHKHRNYNLYLLRPGTPASFPKVLVLIDPDKPLTELLRNRKVLEFPTIHVLKASPKGLPSTFMLEKAYLNATGDPQSESGSSGEDEDMDDSSDDSSSESSENSSEEGEISE